MLHCLAQAIIHHYCPAQAPTGFPVNIGRTLWAVTIQAVYFPHLSYVHKWSPTQQWPLICQSMSGIETILIFDYLEMELKSTLKFILFRTWFMAITISTITLYQPIELNFAIKIALFGTVCATELPKAIMSKVALISLAHEYKLLKGK